MAVVFLAFMEKIATYM